MGILKIRLTYLLVFLLMPFNAFSINIIYDVQILNFLHNLTNPILKSAKLADNSVTIYINNDNTINAFVAGGQNMFINTGLLTTASNYDEVAGVIAHEIGHIKNSHLVATKSNMNKQKIPLFIGLLSGIATAVFAPEAGILIATGSTQVATGNFFANTRAHENEADISSIDYIKQSGYSIKGMHSFMGKLYEQQQIKTLGKDVSWALTHPLSYNRMQLFERHLKTSINVNQNKKLEDEFLLVKAKLNGVNLSPSQVKGYYKNNYNSKYYYYALGISEFNSKNFNQAIMHINKALELSNNNIYIRETKANYLLDMQQPKEAEAIYQSIVKENKDFYYYYMLAYTQYTLEDYEQALKNVNVATVLFKTSPALWHLKAMIYSKTDKKALAELAIAEKFLLIGDYKNAEAKAKNAQQYFEKNTASYLDAKYIIETSQTVLKDR